MGFIQTITAPAAPAGASVSIPHECNHLVIINNGSVAVYMGYEEADTGIAQRRMSIEGVLTTGVPLVLHNPSGLPNQLWFTSSDVVQEPTVSIWVF